MFEGIFMSKNDQLKLSIINDFIYRRITRPEAAQLLDTTERTVTRMANKIRRQGIAGIKHGNSGKTPANKTSSTLLSKAIQKYEKDYFDMNVTHALEYLHKDEEFKNLKYEVFRHKLKSKGLVKRKKRRLSVKRNLRVRSSSEGYILQMDGSHHKWNRKDEWCLIAAIDDATSDIPYGEFFLSEDTLNCMTVIQRIIEKKGIPMAIYVDKAGWFGGLKRQQFSHFKTACEELGIKVIFANSPQAKGRVERAWDTFQDRIIPEMRLRNIHSITAANYYLQKEFIPNYWAKNNTVVARDLEPKYRPIPGHIDLNEIFCLKEQRQVKSDHTISWNGIHYHVKTDLLYAIHKQSIEIRTYQDLTSKAFFAGKEVHLTKVEELLKQTA
jgi:transposase